MNLRELFTMNYNIHPGERIVINHRTGYLSNGFLYFIMDSDQLETVRMEQTVLAYYLIENGFHYTAQPIQNVQEEWFSTHQNKRFVVYQVTERNRERAASGTLLAAFHQVGSAYQFEPQAVSSYGNWKNLWVEKVNLFEEMIEQQFQANKVSTVLLDILPYTIGMSENAIQYVRETEEEELRFSEVDGGSIAFLRYHDQLNQEVIWPDELCYDHPARDLAEFIRNGLLTHQKSDWLKEFIRDYERLRPISVFSWRLIYARLLFPIHLFDLLEAILQAENPKSYEKELREVIVKQRKYEQDLNHFFKKVGISKEEVGLTEVDWLT